MRWCSRARRSEIDAELEPGAGAVGAEGEVEVVAEPEVRGRSAEEEGGIAGGIAAAVGSDESGAVLRLPLLEGAEADADSDAGTVKVGAFEAEGPAGA